MDSESSKSSRTGPFSYTKVGYARSGRRTRSLRTTTKTLPRPPESPASRRRLHAHSGCISLAGCLLEARLPLSLGMARARPVRILAHRFAATSVDSRARHVHGLLVLHVLPGR